MAGRHRQMREASREVERLYYEAREVLRVTGVPCALRAWAAHERFFGALWGTLGPNLETRAFEEAADALREEALEDAAALGPLGAWEAVRLGESQAFHLRGALELCHYVQPKLLVLASAARLALADEPVGRGLTPGSAERIERGPSSRMAAMEWAPKPPSEPRVAAVWEDVERTVGGPDVADEWRALGLWPDLLVAAWERARPRLLSEEFIQAADALRLSARRVARGLPYRVALTHQRVEALGEDVAAVFRVTNALEHRLPAQVLMLALLARDVPGVDARPFPAPARLEPDWVAAEALT